MRTVSAKAMDGSKGGKPAVLVLDEEVPFPPYTGKKIRTLNLLTHLAREFSIDLIVHANQAFDESLAELSRRQITVLVAESKVPPKRGLVFPLRIARNLFSTLPYSVASHYLQGYQEAVRRQTSTKRYCLVHCEWTPYVRYLVNDSIPRVVATHNIEFQIWNRLAESETFPATRAYLKLQARRMMKFERNVFSSSPYLTAVSENDAGVIRGLGGRHVEVVPNGVDTAYFGIRSGEETEPRSLVFTGSMDWRANQEAILWFARSVHPLLKRHGTYRMYVVGRDPLSWMTTPGRLPNEITVTGTVDDVRPYIARAALYVVPLRAGGGSRLKILEALSMGKPVVSTPVGAEGLDLTDGTHVVLADRPEEFVRAIVSLFSDQAKCLALGKEGRQLVVARHDWLGIAHLQAAFWQKAMTELSRQ